MTKLTPFANWIEITKRSGMTYGEIAEMLGVSRQTFDTWKKAGYISGYINKALEVSGITGLSLDELVGVENG